MSLPVQSALPRLRHVSDSSLAEMMWSPIPGLNGPAPCAKDGLMKIDVAALCAMRLAEQKAHVVGCQSSERGVVGANRRI